MIVNMTPAQARQFLDTLPERIAAAMPDMLAATEEPILEGVARNFLNATGPDGSPWPERSDTSLASDPERPLLFETGALFSAATDDAHVVPDATSVSFYVNQDTDIGSVLGAGRHNFGDEPAKYGIPRREFFYVGEDAADATLQAVADVLLEALTL